MRFCRWENAFISALVFVMAGCGGSRQIDGLVERRAAVLAFSAPPVASFVGKRSEYSITTWPDSYAVTGQAATVYLPRSTPAVQFADMTVNLRIADSVKAISTEQLQSLIELYIAYFNRVPDADGLDYWIGELKGGQSLEQIGASFYQAAIQFSSLTGYSAAMSDSEFVEKVYTNVLGRSPDSDGLKYWSGLLSTGQATRGTLIKSILSSAHSFKGDDTYGYVADLLDNKIKVAVTFAVQQGLSYNDSAESIKNTMASVAKITPQSTDAAISEMRSIDWAFNQKTVLAGARIPVLRSSYENKTAASQALGPQWLPPEVAGGNAAAFADFFQEGTYSLVTHTLEYVPDWSPTKFGHIRFYKRNAEGHWADNTDILLKDTTGCLHPRKAIVADFNGDGKPDVFFACHGFDQDPWPGERQHVLLSQADGTYKNVATAETCYCHSASAVDYSGKGFADILVTDNIIAKTPYFFKNNGDGTFAQDFSRIPASTYRYAATSELIDFNKDGRYDLWFAGDEPGAKTDKTYDACCTLVPTVLIADTDNRFNGTQTVKMPAVPEYGFPLDLVYHNGKVYLLRTNIDGGHTNYGISFYTKAAVQMFDPATNASSIVYSHSGQYSNGIQWVNWIAPQSGAVISMDAVYGIKLD